MLVQDLLKFYVFLIEALVALFNSAQNTYEKVLAVKSFGNAGLDTSVAELRKIIKVAFVYIKSIKHNWCRSDKKYKIGSVY